MKYRLLLWTLGLLAVLPASACAPAATPLPAPTRPLEAATQPPLPTEAPTQAPLPVVTSRGPNLEATDPATVSLASGGLQFVEFFRFT